MKTSSGVHLLVAFMLRNTCKASLWTCVRKRLLFIASVMSGCIFSVVWKRSSNSSNFSFLTLNNVLVEADFNIANAVGYCWDAISAFAKTNLLIEVLRSVEVRLWISSTIGNVVSPENFLIMCCGRGASCWVGICPEMNSGIPYWPFRPVNMWWVCASWSRLLLGAYPPLTLGSASNRNISLNDITTETVSARKTIENIKENYTTFVGQEVDGYLL